MERYEIITKTRRVKWKNLHFINEKKGIVDITYKERVPVVLSKPEPTPPADSSIIISENGDFIYHTEGKYRTCILTPKEQQLVRAVKTASVEKKTLTGDDALKMLFKVRFEGDPECKSQLHNMVSKINAKLKKYKIPLKLSFADWIVKFLET